MRIWLEDATFHMAAALRAVGVGLATAAWVSLLTAHIQLPTDARTYAGIGASLVATALTQILFGNRPPSMTVVDLLQPIERDILAVARERSAGDPEELRFVAAQVVAQAAAEIRHNRRLPRDRRAWLRGLADELPSD